MEAFQKYRDFLKNDEWEKWDTMFRPQKKGLPAPPRQKPVPSDALLIDLVDPRRFTVGTMPLAAAIGRRRSRREFTGQPLTLEELSFLLWATQGVQRSGDDGSSMLRTVPSAGARHPFETYILIDRVEGLESGLYRYLALEHKLCFLAPTADLPDVDSWFLEHGDAVLFMWTILPARTEWRYSILAHKMIAMEAGHICQNLYLAATAVGAGACAIGAFNQTEIDTLLDLDGNDEFAIYLARLGKI